MNKALLMACVCIVSFSSVFASVSDSQILEILNRAVGFIDDPDGGPGEVRYAIEMSGYDTNRVVALMKQLIADGTCRNGSTRFYLSEIGKYGTSADLPFLYQRVSETNFCASATEAVLRIEGLTTNSQVRITSLFAG